LSNFDSIGFGNSFSNRIYSTFSAYFESDSYPNDIFDYKGDELILSGNNSMLLSSTYSATFSFSNIDDELESRLRSKLLFLDYDVASKLNFFTDEGEYRLPSSVEFGFTQSINNYFGFAPIVHPSESPSFLTQSEINWWEYWRDSESTFEYYSYPQQMTDATKVLISSYFSTTDSDIDEMVINTISKNSSDILNLAPTILDAGHSRFNGLLSSPISSPIIDYDMYLYDYLMVIRTNATNNLVAEVGDMIRLESDEVMDNFLVNKK